MLLRMTGLVCLLALLVLLAGPGSVYACPS
jgi:hypothetical protein